MNTDLSTRMYNYEVAPPDGVWEAIAAGLNEQGAKVIPIEPKRSSFSYVMIAAAISLVLIVSIVFRMQLKSNSKDALATAHDTGSKHTYVMITNPEGQEVKVSTKVAPMIVSENNQVGKTSGKSEWNKKMEKWKTTMMTATTTNFMDIVDIAANN